MSKLCLTTLLLLAVLPVPAQTLVAGRCAAPPTIDAQASDACWRDAMLATDFAVLGTAGSERAFRQTTLRAAWDEQALYLHVIGLEPDPASVTAAVTERDGQVWLEDAVELFLQPDTKRAEYLHFVVNPRGTLYDERTTDPSFNAAVELRAAIGDQAWQLELALPWAQLGVAAPAVGAEWGFNVAREHRPKEPQEWSTWAPLAKGVAKFGLPELFGRLRLAAQPQAGRASGHRPTAGLITNPDFTRQTGGKPDGWRLSGGSTLAEVAPGAGHYGVRNAADYGLGGQPLDLPVKPGDVFTIDAVIRGSADTQAGIAAVQEMEDGRPDDLYPFWKIQVTGDWRHYRGHIVVDQGAKRLQALSLYRANRQGWVEYAYVQMVPGLLGVRGIADAGRCTRPDERGVGEPWRTPALPSFRPLPGGPLRALVFCGEFQRDAVELAQRLDLTYEVVYSPTYRGSGKVDGVVAFDPEVILRRLAAADYDLIILAGRPSHQEVVDALLGAVERGVGVVVVEPLAGGQAADPAQEQRLRGALAGQALPAERWPEVLGALAPAAVTTAAGSPALKALAVGQHGQGRTLRLAWSEAVSGLIPFAGGPGEYWEYRWAALAKAALWAARRAAPARLTDLTVGPTVTLRASGPAGQELQAEVTWDAPFGLLATQRRAVTLGAEGQATVAFDSPPAAARVRGPVVVRALLRSATGHAVDLAARPLPAREPTVALGALSAPGELTPGAPCQVSVVSTVAAGAQPVLRAELVDAFGRVVDRAEAPPAAGGPTAFTLRVAEPLAVYHRVVVSALDESVLVDRVAADVLVPQAAADHLDDFALSVGYAAMQVRCPEYLRDELAAFFRTHGVRSCTVSPYLVQRGFSAFGGVLGAGLRNSGKTNVRVRCFSNPAELRGLAERATAAVATKRAWGFFGYNLDDETHLSQQGNEEFCACEHCRQGFQAWARTAYGTIAAANREWGTAFDSFEAVTVPLLKDLRGQTNPARWVDFRLHMDRVWANAYAAAHQAVRAQYPDARLSFTNPYVYNSLSGTDFSLWVPHEELLLRYFHRHVADRNKSWSQAPMVSWFGYESSAAECGRFLWWFALNGGVIPIWWDPVEPWAYSGKAGYTAWQMLDPLWRETPRSVAVTRAAEDLQRGLGRLLRVAQPAPAEALVVHSQASLHSLYAAAALRVGRPTNEGYQRYQTADDALAAALKRAGLAYRYVLAADLSPERLAGAQLVVLPSCVALSDEAAAALTQYVAGGGKVLADLLPATQTAHGAPRAASPLAAVFPGQRAICLGESATASHAAALDDALAKLALRPACRWQLADGSRPVGIEAYRFALGAAEYLGVVGAASPPVGGEVVVRLPARRFVYDSRAGELLGELDEVRLTVPPADARFLALLPYRVAGLEAACRVAGRQLQLTAQVRCVGQPTTHVLHVAVTPPGQASPAVAYTRNLVATAGRLVTTVPLALSDAPGEWRATIRDAATGVTAEATFRVP